MAHFPPALVQAFLQGLRRAGVRPGGLKAVLTPTNAQWDSLALYTELCREREAISQARRACMGRRMRVRHKKTASRPMFVVGTPFLFYSFGSSLVQCGQRVALSLISPKQ